MTWEFYVVVGVFIFFGCCAATVHYLAADAPRIEPTAEDDIEYINRLLGRARFHRDQLDALATSFVDWHDPETDFEVDELYHCVMNSADYAETITRIMEHKYPKVER